ncbi:polymorphic outer membrane protein middle domain-containing protein [Chlamydia vaughanii]|uniref:polymorphic outer membrane protein middle domain-containing protein n=1 Tax=Chlamydia vaughanii TaxID=3112552 RepID=UPI0032B2DF26
MQSYLYSFFFFVSLSGCFYHASGFAKEKKIYQFENTPTTVSLQELADAIENLDPKTFVYYGLTHKNDITSNDTLKTAISYEKHFMMSYLSTDFGGAFRVYELDITHNVHPVIFQDNAGWRIGGGAFWVDTCRISDNPKGVLFQNNCVPYGSGGGLLVHDLYIHDNGPVLFLNNTSSWGAGLQNSETQGKSANISMSADYGDIIFNGNIVRTSTGCYRNAFHTAKEGLHFRAGAKKGRRVAFYDPIESGWPANDTLIFNHENYHLGTVLFSGVLVDPVRSSRADYWSYFKNPMAANYGVLAVEENAGLAMYSFSQNENILRLGNAAVITTEKNTNPSTTANCAITIKKLALNLPSICKEGARPPKIWIYPTVTTVKGQPPTYAEDNNPTITVSGPLTLLDSDNQDPYDSVDLSNNIKRLPLLYLCENTNKQIDTANLNIGTLNDTTHYGHQGVWKPYWESKTTVTDSTSDLTANTKHRYLYADWTRTGYTVNPKYNTPLITNTLWQSLYSTMSGMRSLHSPQEDIPSIFEFSGKGLGISITQKDRSEKRGFRMESGGYAVGTNTTRKFSLSFAQQFSSIKEKVTSNKISSRNYFMGIKFCLPMLDETITTTGSLAYNYGDHKAKHYYREDLKTSRGSFYSRGMAASVKCSLPTQLRENHLVISPFAEAIVFRGTLSHCTETGDFPRAFSTSTPLTTFTLPLGMTMQWAHDTRHPKQWKIQLAYQPMIYKKTPQIRTTLLSSNGTWLSSGTPISRNTVAMNINNETQLRDSLKLILNYQGEISSSTFANYLTTGSSITF